MPDGPTETLRSTSNFRRLNEPGTGLDPSAHEDTARRRHRWDRLFVVIHYQPAADLDFDSRQSTGAGDCGHEPFEDDLLLFEPAAVRGHCLPVVHRRGARPFSTYVMESCAFLARNFSRCASRSIFMGLWRHFARGSNFWNLALFGSGYAGLGYILSLVGNPEGKIGSYLLPGLMPDTSILPGTSCKRRVLTQMLQMQNTGSFHQNGARPPTAPRRT